MMQWILAGFLVSAPAEAAILQVPYDYTTIMGAYQAASNGDTILVADGIYSGPGNRNLNFAGKLFTLKSENGPANCTINGGPFEYGFPVLRFNNCETPAAVVDGFTITGAGNRGARAPGRC